MVPRLSCWRSSAGQRRGGNFVATILLGEIETVVGSPDQFIARRSMLRIRRHSCADGDRSWHARKLPALDHLPQLLPDAHGVLHAGLSQQNSELFATVAANDVDLPQLLMK